MSLIPDRANACNSIPSRAETAPITVVMAGEPVAKARLRVTRRSIAYTPAHTRKYEAHGRFAAQLAMGDRPPIAMPVRLELAGHDREWWREEAVCTGTDWSGVVGAALELIVAAGIVEQPHPETITPWDAPSWREAAAEYHRNRSGRLAVEIEPKRLERLRPLMAIDAARAESLRMERAAVSEVEVSLTGVFELPKAAGQILEGAAIWWDTSPGNVINAPAAGAYPIGVAVRGDATEDATCRVRLSGIPVVAAGA